MRSHWEDSDYYYSVIIIIIQSALTSTSLPMHLWSCGNYDDGSDNSITYLHISQLFSLFPQREMTWFDHKFSVFSPYLQAAQQFNSKIL